nr:MAG TPA: hypothetical protein [Microviridae sp.]
MLICISRALPEPGVFKGIRFRLSAAVDRVKLASSFLHCVAVAHKKSVVNLPHLNNLNELINNYEH